MWPKCETPYLYRVLTVRYGCPPSPEALLVGFKEDLQASGMKLRFLRCDAVERHHLLKMVGCNGLSGCDWCLAKGTRTFNPGVTAYPADCRTAEGKKYRSGPRSHEGNVALATIAENTDGNEAECGILGRTPLLDIPGFDIVDDVVLEAMHAKYEGSTRRLMIASLPKPNSRETVQRVRLNKLLLLTRGWSEWPRAPRRLDIPHYKASELFFFLQHVAPCLALEHGVFKEDRNLRLIWAIASFVGRAVELPDDFFQAVEREVDLDSLMHRLNCVIDEEFDMSQSTYNIHIVCQHLVPARRKFGPISAMGTWGTESIFKYVRQCFGQGTRTVGKQVLENINVDQMLAHRCLRKTRPLKYTCKTQKRNDDSMAYTVDGTFFKIVKDLPDNTYLGYDVATTPFRTDHLGLGMLNWSNVAVARITNLHLPDLDEARRKGLELKQVTKEAFRGKAVLAGRTISFAPAAWASLQIN